MGLMGWMERGWAIILILIWLFGSLKSFPAHRVDVSCKLWI